MKYKFHIIIIEYNVFIYNNYNNYNFQNRKQLFVLLINLKYYFKQ